MANFALNYSFSRNLNIPLDEDAVKATLAEVKDYVATKGKCYAGQVFSVTGDTGNNGLYYTLAPGAEGTVIRVATQDKLDEIAASAGKIDEIRVNGSALTINDKVVNIDLSDYASIIYVNDAMASAVTESKNYVDTKLVDFATKSYVTDQIVSAMTGGEIELTGYAKEEDVNSKIADVYASGKTYTDSAISVVSENFNWIPVEGDIEVHKVRNWKGTRDKYEFLLTNNALSPWTRYVVIDTINDEEVITEYYGVNQIADITGQLLPVNSILSDISEATAEPYMRYLVGANGVGYKVYECILDGRNTLKWNVKNFDYRYGVRVIDRGLKNYVYIDGTLKTYDDVDCGTF